MTRPPSLALPASAWLRPAMLALSLLMPAWSSAAAKITFEPGAGTGYAAAAVPQGVRAVGMGEAYAAAADDAAALHWNPAGLSRLGGFSLGLAHNEWAPDLGFRQESLVYAQQSSPGAGFALGVDYMSLGQLDRRDSNGALLGRSAASAFHAALGYGRAFQGGRLRLGVSGGYLSQSLYESGQSAVVGGLGLSYDPFSFAGLGLALRRVGLAVEGAAPPSDLLAGLVLRLKKTGLLWAFEAGLPFLGSPELKTGLELDLKVARLRGGYRQPLGADPAASNGGLSLGAGFQVGLLGLDYSFVPHNSLSPSHRLEATLALPADFFRPRLVAEGTSQTAETYYKEALAQERAGETLKALFLFQRSAEAYPEALKASPQDFYVVSLQKAQELQEKLYKGGDRRQIQKLVNEALENSARELKAGRYREALGVIKQAQQIDPDNAELAQAAQEAQQGLEERLKSSRELARLADKGGDLAVAVEHYRKLLAVDPADAEALGYLNRRRRELKELLQALDRQAIYHYVAGKVEEAEAAWAKCEALDHFGDVDFRRNLERARKQLGPRKK